MPTAVFAAYALYISNIVCVCVEGLEYLQSLNLERVVMCQLNPLKLCLPTVTSMFAAITRYRLLIKLVKTLLSRGFAVSFIVERSNDIWTFTPSLMVSLESCSLVY